MSAGTATRKIKIEKPMAIQTYGDDGHAGSLSAVDKGMEVTIDANEAKKLVGAHAASYVDEKTGK